MMLRQVLFSMIILLMVSCSQDSNDFFDADMASSESDTYDEFLTVSKVLIPQDIRVNTLAKIKVYYNIPGTCYQFKDIYHEKKDSLRTYAVVSEVLKREDCKDSLRIESIDLDFKTDKLGTYYLRFWNGKDSNEEVKYLTYDIEVKE